MSEVFVHLSRTVNLGNYESMKIDVGLTLSCDKEGLETAYAECKAFVEEKVKEQMQEIVL
jgi:hypothetical protein